MRFSVFCYIGKLVSKSMLMIFGQILKIFTVCCNNTLKTHENKVVKPLEIIWEDRAHREDSGGKENNISVRPNFEG